MKHHWSAQELVEHWSLTQEQLSWVRNRTDRSRLGFAALLKFFEFEGRFPNDRRELPMVAIDHLAVQLELNRDALADYDLGSRSAKRDRSRIRQHFGFRQATLRDGEQLAKWLKMDVLPTEHRFDRLRDSALAWYRRYRIEPPTMGRLDRIVASALNAFQATFFAESLEQIPLPCRVLMDALLEAHDDHAQLSDVERTPIANLRSDPGRPSLESVLKEIKKLESIAAVNIPADLFKGVPSSLLRKYRHRAATGV